MEIRHNCPGSTVYDTVDAKAFRRTPLFRTLNSLPKETQSFLFGLLSQIVAGRFERILDVAEGEQEKHRDEILRLAGISDSLGIADIAKAFGFESEFEKALASLSLAFAEVKQLPAAHDVSISLRSRSEFYGAVSLLKAVYALIEATKVMQAKRPNFLKSAMRILVTEAERYDAHCIVMWPFLRNHWDIISTEEIMEIVNSISDTKVNSE